MAYLLLTCAIFAEIAGTLSLRAADGMSKPYFLVAVVVGYLLAFTFLALALQKGMNLSIAYGVWAAAGVALVSVLSVPLFGERLTLVQIVGLALVTIGVAALELGAER
jgi:small multidrug resistance pump